MGNIFTIKHGAEVPSGDNLEPHELGFCDTNNALYIKNEKGEYVTLSSLPQKVKAKSQDGTKNLAGKWYIDKKFNNFCECWGSFEVNITPTSAWGSIFPAEVSYKYESSVSYSEEELQPKYPVIFIEKPIIVAYYQPYILIDDQVLGKNGIVCSKCEKSNNSLLTNMPAFQIIRGSELSSNINEGYIYVHCFGKI